MNRQPARRADFRHFRTITTRWADNDVYGHINNVEYYAFFDTVVNGWLVEAGLLDFEGGPTISLVAETTCRYHAPLAFPQTIEAGLAVARLGTSSVTYAIGIFAEGDRTAAADGRFIHVHVDRLTRRPVPMPEAMRQTFAPLLRD